MYIPIHSYPKLRVIFFVGDAMIHLTHLILGLNMSTIKKTLIFKYKHSCPLWWIGYLVTISRLFCKNIHCSLIWTLYKLATLTLSFMLYFSFLLQLLRLGVIGAPCAIWVNIGLKIVSFDRLNPWIDFHQFFRICLSSRGLRKQETRKLLTWNP